MDLLTRLLIACLSVWFIDQCLTKFGAGEPGVRIFQILVIIVAAIFIVVGGYFIR